MFLQKNYDFGYAVKEYDEYGNPNVHSRHEVRDGYQVKGKNFFIFLFKKKSKIKYQTKFNKAALKVKLQKN